MSSHPEELSVDGWIASCAAAADDAERDAASIDQDRAVGNPGQAHSAGRRIDPAPADQDPTR